MSEYIEVTKHYRSRSTNSQTIKPGVYHKDDPALYGKAIFLVNSGRANWTHDKMPQASSAKGPSAEDLRARKESTHVRVTKGYRSHSTESALIAPDVYEKRDKRLFGKANFLVETGRAHWCEAPGEEPDVAIKEVYLDTEQSEGVEVDELMVQFGELQPDEPDPIAESVDAEGDNVPGDGVTEDDKEQLVQWVDPLLVSAVFENAIASPLMNDGIKKMNQLYAMSHQDILDIPGIGDAKLQEIVRVMGEKGNDD